MRAGAPLFALALSGRAAAAFVQGGVGGAPAAAAPGRPLAAAGPPPAAEEEELPLERGEALGEVDDGVGFVACSLEYLVECPE